RQLLYQCLHCFDSVSSAADSIGESTHPYFISQRVPEPTLMRRAGSIKMTESPSTIPAMAFPRQKPLLLAN
ncbi:MAG TPA: hypothetical protein VHX11_06145, partial [Acidobacteriaceae bacterium]|nr:hypothetical protein [Acidobacteriaceae bacterium]